MQLRKARLSDAGEIHALMQPFVARGVLLPRSNTFLCQNIRNFSVIEDAQHRILASGALRFLDQDVAEIQSLAVLHGQQGGGLGRRLVDALLAEAREHQVWQVIALTHNSEFFERLGFRAGDRMAFPQKFTADCLGCARLKNCRQVAMTYDVFPADAVASAPLVELAETA